MPRKGKAATARSQKGPQRTDNDEPKSLRIAEQGIQSSRDFRNFMSAIMSDVIAGRMTPQVTNAACNASGKLLKMVDLEYKYGTNPERKRAVLTVAFEELGPNHEPAALPPGEPAREVEVSDRQPALVGAKR